MNTTWLVMFVLQENCPRESFNTQVNENNERSGEECDTVRSSTIEHYCATQQHTHRTSGQSGCRCCADWYTDRSHRRDIKIEVWLRHLHNKKRVAKSWYSVFSCDCVYTMYIKIKWLTWWNKMECMKIGHCNYFRWECMSKKGRSDI